MEDIVDILRELVDITILYEKRMEDFFASKQILRRFIELVKDLDLHENVAVFVPITFAELREKFHSIIYYKFPHTFITRKYTSFLGRKVRYNEQLSIPEVEIIPLDNPLKSEFIRENIKKRQIEGYAVDENTVSLACLYSELNGNIYIFFSHLHLVDKFYVSSYQEISEAIYRKNIIADALQIFTQIPFEQLTSLTFLYFLNLVANLPIIIELLKRLDENVKDDRAKKGLAELIDFLNLVNETIGW